uniref:Uncharacterized protein n=1 Tax=Candidatus Methanogaster sp. ANME-2c ERB4 TaxID=2759911 RepID=A0A7G9YAP7_9EURY|nr:hypothetical protein HFPHJBHB_00004 [Methanosarcinales archaeon ANME-2c ERB4]QNO45081.1 hypothetical protein AMIKMAHL_00001 [Methanosarcinales archaeon ANME-2c ERB4]QNO46289.1 hypothetical protein AGGMKIHI_00001 [Methanosarcinales archaeon ANME-2c ERB4]
MFRAESAVIRAALIPLSHRVINTSSIVLELCKFLVERGIRPVHIIECAMFRTGLFEQHLSVLFVYSCIDHLFAFRAQRFCLHDITFTDFRFYHKSTIIK